ncbi:uncharacterized protein [Aquarana catesbeiana]|uniref:uncharacterized protein isoform X2 n=1 Tax=Aquarana catesbeiana TaxID=8400 RepID=UPI003CC92873
MKFPDFFFLLLLHRSCSALDVVGTKTHNALIGSTTVIPCSFTVDSPPINPQFLAILWQYEEKELVRYDNKEKSATPRMSIDEKETRQGNASLTIHNVTIDDQGTYKCLVIYSPDRKVKEIQLNIQAEPKITFFSSYNGDKEIFVCEVKEFYPEAVEIKWLIDGKMTEPSRRNADGTYNKWDHFLISGNQKKPNKISCVVEHETLDSPLMENLKVKDGKDSQTPVLITSVSVLTILLTAGILAALWIYKKKYFQRFQVSPIHIPRGWSRNTDEKVTMYCTAFNCPGKIHVTWTVVEKTGENVSIADHQTRSDGEESGQLMNRSYAVVTDQFELNGLYNAITSLTFTPTILKHRNTKVTCSFLSSGKSIKKDKDWSFITSKPCLSTPLKMSLGDLGDVVCSVTLEKFYPKNIEIKWSSGVGNYQELEHETNFIDESDYTFKCESECRVPGNLFKDPGFRVRVTWTHQSLNHPQNQEVTATDLPWFPLMEDIPVPLLVHGREAKLQCEIRGFFPNNLEVKWLRREAEKEELYDVSSSDKYKIPMMETKQDFNKTYICSTSLIVSMSAITDKGVEFICRVTHPSLKTYLEKRTGELRVKGEPVIRRILQSGVYIILEVDSLYTKDPVVTWEDSNKQHGQYKRFAEKHIRSFRRESSDGSYSLTFICEALTLGDLANPMNKYIRATIKHEALESAKNIYFLRTKGYFYILFESGKKQLDQADRETSEMFISNTHLEIKETENSVES